MRGVMDAFSDPKVKRVIGMFSAQVGKSTVIENVIGYYAHHDPSPILIVQPTLEMAESFSKQRLACMIRDTQSLKERFAAAGSKSSGDTLLSKSFIGGHVTLAGSNSYNSLASRPIRVVLGDEAAKWKPNEKGSPFRQVSARVRAFWNSKQGYLSTPTDAHPDNEFHQLWEQSDKRIYFIQCPHCPEQVVFTFDETPNSLPTDAVVPQAILRWTEGVPVRKEDGGTIRRADDAWFECLSCSGRIDDADRHRAVRDSNDWRPTKEFHGTAGFWGWQALSPFTAAIDIANEWLGALGSTIALQSVKNETLGLPWAESGDAPEWKQLFDRRDQDYTLGTVPDGVLFLTAGCDVQNDRIEIQTVGWGRRRRSWLVDYTVLDGDTARSEVWQDLTKILGTLYQHPSGVDLPIKKLAIDSGYNTQHVYEWARQNRFAPIAVVKGGPDSQTAPVSAPSPVDITVRGKKLASGIKVQTLNVGHFKSEFYGLLKLELPNIEKGEDYPDAWFTFPALSDTEEYCRQLTAEQVVTRSVKGYQRRAWEKTRPRNEALDTWVYARAAAFMLGIDRFTDQHWAAIERQMNIPVQPAQISPVPIRANPEQPLATPKTASSPFRSSNKESWLPKRGGWFNN